MTWQPTRKILTPRAIPENLITYCLDETRQAAALIWAGGDGLKPIRTFQATLAEPTTPAYPSIAFSDDNDGQSLDDDLNNGQYVVTFEISVQNRAADTAVTQARAYQAAFLSMMVNCPEATLKTSTGAVNCVIAGAEIGFLPILTSDRKNDYLQRFQIRLTVLLVGGAY